MITLCAAVGWPNGVLNKVGAAVVKAAQPSRIYHVGLLGVDGYLSYLAESRMRTGVAFREHLRPVQGWTYLDLPWSDEQAATDYFNARLRADYDLLGLVDWGFRRAVLTLMGEEVRPRIEDPRREMCSELVAGMLGFDQPVRWSPSAVWRECERRNLEHERTW